MASNRKKVDPPAYNDPGWGDSISVSKKARQELADNNVENQEPQNNKLIENKNDLTSYKNYSKNTGKKTQNNRSTSEYNEMSSQVEQINEEINRAVTEIEGVLERFLNQLSSAVSNFFLAFYSLFLKAVLIIFVQPLKNAGKLSGEFIHILNNSLEDLNTWLSGGKPQQKKSSAKKVTTSLQHAVNASNNQETEVNRPLTETDKKKIYPAVFDGIRFGELASQGIVFLNIKNIPMYDINQKSFSIEEEQKMLDNAIAEINACSKLAKSLPSPNKGRYINRPMIEILETAKMEDLKAFLQYVYTHPKPFTDRQLRLSEAFATWAHKGAPV